MHRRTGFLFFFFVLLFLSQPLFAQQQKKKKKERSDSNYTRLDSTMMQAAERNKITYWLFRNIYDKPSGDNHEVDKNGEITTEQADHFDRYEGSIIRHIYIKVLDPFGTNVDDTLDYTPGKLGKAGNNIAIKTTRRNVRDQLLFEAGDEVDPLQLRETERLLRRQEYIRDSRILIAGAMKGKKQPDSVDVIVIVQDRWSLNGSAGISPTNATFDINQSNFLGMGNKIYQSTTYNITDSKFTHWEGLLQDQNIRNTYITGSLFYNTAPESRYQGASLERTFYSTLTKWAGGASVVRHSKDLNIGIGNSQLVPAPLHFFEEDFWIGRSFPFSRNTEAGRNSSIVLSTRVFNTHYTDRPTVNLDTLMLYQRSTLLLGSIGFSSRRYYKDKKIFRFGNVEDVPEGRLLALVGGTDIREFERLVYTGVLFGAGQHLERFGYLSGSVQYGTFYNKAGVQKGVVNTDLTYFSDLFSFGKWNIRQFIYFRNTNGLRRSANEFITLNGRNMEGLYGFNSTAVSGTNKALLKFESIVYTPIDIAGFQFATVVFAGFGMIGGPDYNRLINSTIYQAYGLGFLIRKENLVVNTFRVSFGYYPNLPTGTGADFRVNPVGINNLSLKDFNFSRPELINYQ